MSEQNVEIVHAAFDAWNRRDFDAAVSALHDDAELHFIGGFADLMGTEFKGREGILRFWREWLGSVGGQVEIESTREAGDRIVVIATIVGAGEASGTPAKLRFGQVWSFRDARVSRVDGYYEPSAALEAAGLSE
jgi:ketosteroid isomerase-like protein